VNISVSMENGALSEAPSPPPWPEEEDEEPDFEEPPEDDAFCAGDEALESKRAATRKIVVRGDDRFISGTPWGGVTRRAGWKALIPGFPQDSAKRRIRGE
jgi:hypothetical protein